MLTLFAFLFVIGLLVFFHELGHFLVAKWSGILVYTFSFGFGPKLFGFKWGETEYVVSLLPLGGYVKMAGEDKEEDENVPENRKFNTKPIWIRALIVVAGPFMNFILAIVIFSLLFMSYGVPSVQPIIDKVIEGGPAYIAGIQPGDKIIEINGKKVTLPEEIARIVNESLGKKLKITVERNGKHLTFEVTPIWDNELKRARLFILFKVVVERYPFIPAVKKGIYTTFIILQLIIVGLWKIITGSAPLEVAGPLGIAQMAGEAAKSGWVNLLNFSALLSVYIGFLNLLPLPVLDGGVLLLLGIEKLRGKPLEKEKMQIIYYIGISILLILFLFGTYSDLLRIFK